MPTVTVTVTLDYETFKIIREIAKKRLVSKAQVIRDLVNITLGIEELKIAKESLEKIQEVKEES